MKHSYKSCLKSSQSRYFRFIRAVWVIILQMNFITPDKVLGKWEGTSLAIQWLRLGAFTAGAQVQTLVEELRSPKAHGMAREGLAPFLMMKKAFLKRGHLNKELKDGQRGLGKQKCIWNLQETPRRPV